MEEEEVFEGFIRVMTKDFGISNDANDPTLTYQKEGFSSNESRILIMNNSKFVTVGKITFLVGTPYAAYNDILYNMAFDVDLIPQSGEQWSTEVWIPSHQIISIIPEPQGS